MIKLWEWIKANSNKVVLGGLSVLVIGLLIWILLLQQSLHSKQSKLEEDIVTMKYLGDGIYRSQIDKVSSEELEKYIKGLSVNLDLIKKDLEKMNANITAVNSIIVSTPGYIGSDLPSDGSNPGPKPKPIECKEGICENPDKYGYLNNEQISLLTEPFSKDLNVPFGKVSFKAWNENPWNKEILSRNYKVSTVWGEDEDGKKYAYNQFEIEVDGKTYKVPIKEAKLVQEERQSKFRFDPRMYLGLMGGVNFNSDKGIIAELVPHASLFLFSYGKTKAQPEWSAGGIGLGWHTQQAVPALVITPITYNLGREGGFVRNLHIAPSVSVDIKGSVTVGAAVEVGL